MNEFYYPNFNHKVTFLGGQSFSWDLIDTRNNTYLGFTDDRVIKIKVLRDRILWQTYPEKDDVSFIKRYFKCNQKYDDIINIISKDKYVSEAITQTPNIRILQQPFDFTVLTFILSANNNIVSIRRSVRKLAQMFGRPVDVPGVGIVHRFPQPEVIQGIEEEDLRKSGVGFRAKYIKKTAEGLYRTGLCQRMSSMGEDELRDSLVNFYGVGDKIADCVLVFAAGFDNVTPIDVWTKRMLIDLYGLPENWKYGQYRSWTKDKFNGYAAYAGQFLFEWYRNLKFLD